MTTPLGRVLRDEDGIGLELIRTYDDPVEDVWSTLTEPDRVPAGSRRRPSRRAAVWLTG